MKYKLLTWTFVFLILASSVLAVNIEGIVRDAETKDSIPIANIVVKQDGQTITATTTDINGRFSLTVPRAGTYAIGVTHIGYLESSAIISTPATALTINLEETAILMEETIVVGTTLYGHLVGRIRDQDGSNVEGATIRIQKGSFSDSEQTNRLGSYLFSFLEPGDYSVAIEKSGYGTTTSTVTILGEEFVDGNFNINRLTGTSPEATPQTIQVTTTGCGRNYDYVLIPDGSKLNSPVTYNSNLYTGDYSIDGQTQRRDNAYLFSRGLPQEVIFDSPTNVFLYRGDMGSDSCGRQMITYGTEGCTDYQFTFNNGGAIIFQICPPRTSTPTETPVRAIPTEICSQDSCGDEEFCDYDGSCSPITFSPSYEGCIDTNYYDQLATDEGLPFENQIQFLGGYCLVNGQPKLDTKVDDNTIQYYSCSNNCATAITHTCDDGVIMKTTREGYEVAACRNEFTAETTQEETTQEEPEELIQNLWLSESELIEASLCKFIEKTGTAFNNLNDWEITKRTNDPNDDVYILNQIRPFSITEYTLTTSTPLGGQCTYTLDNEDYFAVGGTYVKPRIIGNELIIQRILPGEDTFLLFSSNGEVGEVLVQDVPSAFPLAPAAIVDITGKTIDSNLCELDNLYMQLANLQRPYWAWGDGSRRTFLDREVGSKLLIKEGYGTLTRTQKEGVNYIEGFYSSSRGEIPKVIVSKNTVSSLLGKTVQDDLKYFMITTNSDIYISTGSDNVIKLPQGIYLIPESYKPYIGITNIDFENLFSNYDTKATMTPRTVYLDEDHQDIIFQNLRILNNEIRKDMEIPKEAVSYGNYFYVELQTPSNGLPAGWYAVPVYKFTEPGYRPQKRRWDFNIEKMRELQQALNPGESWVSTAWDCIISPWDCVTKGASLQSNR